MPAIAIGFACTMAMAHVATSRLDRDLQPAVLLFVFIAWAFVYWVLRERSRRGQELEPPGIWITRWGVVLGLAIVSLGVSSFNTGVNLLYVLFSSLAVAFVLNLPIAILNVPGLRALRRAPDRVYAGETIRIGLKFEGGMAPWSGMGIVLRDIPAGPAGVESPNIRALYAPRNDREEILYETQAVRRGIFHWRATRVASAFPFGLISVSRDLPNPGRIVIYPRLGFMRRPIRTAGTTGELRRAARASFDEPYAEFHNLREYRHGDNPRLIHWRTTAKQNKLFVREFERRAESETLILLDTYCRSSINPDSSDALEIAVSFAATAARDLCRAQLRIGVAFLDDELTALPPSSGSAHYHRILEALAGLKASASPTLRRLIECNTVHSMIACGAARVIVVTPEAKGIAAEALGPLSEHIYIVSIADGAHERDFGFSLDSSSDNDPSAEAPEL